MDVQPRDVAEEIKHLQRCINDLISVLALPARWIGGEPTQIVDVLLDALLRMLQLDLVYVQLNDTNGQASVEMARLAQPQRPADQPHEIGKVLKQSLGTDVQKWPLLTQKLLGDLDISVVPLGLGLQGEIGVIVAGSKRADFPLQTERLILSVAANHASIALQEARLRSDQKRLASELDRLVAQRTTELASANTELRKEIAERKHAEEHLRRSEEKYRVILEAANDAVVSMDESGTILLANAAVRRIFGYDPVEIIGKPLTLLMPDYMRELHEGGFARYLATGQRHINWQGTELTALRKSGEEFPVEVSFGEQTRDGRKSFTGFLRDISKRRQAETALRAAMEERTRISAFREEIGVALSHQVDLKVALHNCAHAAVRHLDAAFARIWTLSGDGRELELQASAGMYTHLDGLHSRIAVGQHKIGLIAQERKPHLTNEAQNDPRVSDKDWARREKMTSFAGYPLVLEERLVGVMGMFSQKPLTESTLEALSYAAGIIAQGIERRRAEEALRRSEAFLAEGQRLGQIGSYSWRVATDKIEWSNELYRIYEFEIGVPVTPDLIRTRVHPQDISLYEKMVEKARDGGNNFEWQFRLLMADQSIKYLHSVAHAIRDQSGQLEYIAVAQDVTERRQSEEALRNTQAQLSRATRAATVGEFAASIAHEINQPLAAVVANGHACLRWLSAEPPGLARAQEAAERIVRDGKEAGEILRRIRALFKRAPLEKTGLDLNEVIVEVLRLLAGETSKRLVSVEMDLGNNLETVEGDRVQLQQLLFNLLQNGIEAMDRVAERPKKLFIRTRLQSPETVLVEIRDWGIGIENPEKAFEAFFTTKESGMGMGLAICRSIIDAHHGRLWAVPAEGCGTTFSFTLPAQPKVIA